MKLIAFISMLSIMLFMLGLAAYCLMVAGSNADDEMLGNLQYMNEEERKRFFNDDNN